MNVTDLKDRESVDEIELDIVEKEEPREFTSQGREGRVCNAVGKDDEGDEVKVTLWNDEIDEVEEGQRIRITNGWSKRYQGEMELSAGRYGEIEVVE